MGHNSLVVFAIASTELLRVLLLPGVESTVLKDSEPTSAPALGRQKAARLAFEAIADVIAVVEGAGIFRRVARLRPMGVIKG